jgi:hypothetical protein
MWCLISCSYVYERLALPGKKRTSPSDVHILEDTRLTLLPLSLLLVPAVLTPCRYVYERLTLPGKTAIYSPQRCLYNTASTAFAACVASAFLQVRV